ncbi:MAG: hypothetical protein AUI10_04955 [Actinobacteria bacterium 13_2_20CM_2_72_6]|nr:MAG: hypothetical protein AUI10_04955 [Actinobacteria bacterium 13_2_20CM_2_72_6]
MVPAAADVAFAAFTSEIGSWWPVGAGHSVYGDWSTGTVAFRDGQLVESGPSGATAVWGTVLDWEPPHRVRLTWHPGSDPAKASEVEVTFARRPATSRCGWRWCTRPVPPWVMPGSSRIPTSASTWRSCAG